MEIRLSTELEALLQQGAELAEKRSQIRAAIAEAKTRAESLQADLDETLRRVGEREADALLGEASADLKALKRNAAEARVGLDSAVAAMEALHGRDRALAAEQIGLRPNIESEQREWAQGIWAAFLEDEFTPAATGYANAIHQALALLYLGGMSLYVPRHMTSALIQATILQPSGDASILISGPGRERVSGVLSRLRDDPKSRALVEQLDVLMSRLRTAVGEAEVDATEAPAA